MKTILISLSFVIFYFLHGSILNVHGQLDNTCQIIFELTLPVCDDSDCEDPSSFVRQLALLDIKTGNTTIIPNTEVLIDYFLAPNHRLFAAAVGGIETRIFEVSRDSILLLHTIPAGLIKAWKSDSTNLLLKDVSNNTGVYFVYDVITETPVYLNQDALNIIETSWSFDGERIALTANRFPFEETDSDLNHVLYITTEDAAEYQQESASEKNVYDFTWMVDGALAYTMCDNTTCSLILLDKDGDRNSYLGSYGIVAASPIEPILLLMQYNDDLLKLVLLDTQTGQFTTLESSYLYPYIEDDYNIEWSPNGRYIAYINNAENDTSKLNIYDLVEEDVKKIDFDLGDDISEPNWHPNSNELVFDGSTQAENKFFIYNTISGNTQNLSNSELEGYADAPKWICP